MKPINALTISDMAVTESLHLPLSQKNLSPLIHFHLPTPRSSSSSSSSETNSSPVRPIPFHLPIPGSQSSTSTYLSTSSSRGNSSIIADTEPVNWNTSHILSELQCGFHQSEPVMSDNNSESSSEYVPSAESSEDEVNSTEEEVIDTNSDKEFDYTNLAAFLINSNNDTFNFTTEEDSIIKGSCVNTVRYKKSKVGVENRFFDMIEQLGGKEMKPLLEFIEVKQIKERRFYVILRGRRNEHKRIILSKCLLLCALKWRNQTKKDFGKQLQPDTWATMLRTLFSIFKSKGILFKHTRDFNNDGEFHAVLKKQWDNEIQVDDTFGTGVRTSDPDLEADRKIREAFDAGKFDPFSTSDGPAAYEHRLWYIVFVLGRYWLVRGRKEIAFLRWSQVKFCTATENHEQVEFIKIIHHFDKGNKLSIQNTTARSKKELPPRLYPNENDPLCPVKFMKFFRTLCCPEQERVICRMYNTKQMKKWKKNNEPYLYNPNLWVGENNIDGINKEFAEYIGFDNPERCTNHSNRKLGISTAVTNAPVGIQHVVAKASRHKNVNTQKHYFKESSDVMQAYSRAISGKHVPSPTKSPKKSNKKPNKRSTPESHRKPSHINIPGESNTVSNVTFTNSDDSFIAPNEVAASTDTLPLQVLVPYDATEPIQQKLRPNDTVSFNEESSENKNLTYNNLYNKRSLPLVTPNATYPSIVTQHHLNQIQRNIFIPNDAVRDDKVDLLHAQIQRLQQHLEETEKKKKEDELLSWKEKYQEAKLEAWLAQLQQQQQNKYMCVIQ